MAIAYQTQYSAIQNILKYFPSTISMADYSAVLKPLIVEAQTQGILGDATATTFLKANRVFILNNDGVSRTFNYNGQPFVLTANTSWALHPDEAAFFLGQAVQNGFNVVNDPAGTSYFGGTGTIQFFFF